MTRTFGPAFDDKKDGRRLRTQMGTIREHMLLAGWKTLAEIERSLGYPQSSISAQLRHLRKPEFGEFLVDKRRRPGTSSWEYRVRRRPADPNRPVQDRLFETAGRSG